MPSYTKSQDNRTPIDVKRLIKALSDKGQTLSGVCKYMGRSNVFFQRTAELGGLKPPEVSFLRAEYGIEPEDYAPISETCKVTDPLETRSLVRGVIADELKRREYIETLREYVVRPTIRAEIFKAIESDDFISAMKDIIKDAMAEI